MVFHINGDRRAEENTSNFYFEHLNSVYKDLLLEDSSPDDGRLIEKRGLSVGRPWHPPKEKIKVELKRWRLKSWPLLDAFMLPPNLLITRKFRDLIEAVEPNVHRFIEADIVIQDEIFETHSLLNICNRLDTLDKNRSFPLNERGFFSPVADEPRELVFSREKIGNCHVWRDKFFQGLFVSNFLFDKIEGAGITGLTSIEYDEG